MNRSVKLIQCLILFFSLMFFENFCTSNAINLDKHISKSENPIEEIINNKHSKRNYDEYPMIVPKRAALLLDRLMIALQNVLEGDRNEMKTLNGYYGNGNNMFGQHRQKLYNMRPNPRLIIKNLPIEFDTENGQYNLYPSGSANYKTLPELKSDNFDMDLMAKNFQRRAHDEENFGSQIGRIYWRCYFNAITCF